MNKDQEIKEKKMKAKRLVILIENKKGEFYQVALKKDEIGYIFSLLEYIFNYKPIKILSTKLPLYFDDNE